MGGTLQGMRVLDATTAWAGPYCGMLLADMGAEVIKIENAQEDRSAGFSTYPPYFAGQSAIFMMFNRNKRSFTVNLKDPRGREALLKLAQKSDVFIQNFRPGVVERLGVDYETMHKLNPTLVYCSISGYGSNSPYSSFPCVNVLAEAFAGFLSITGEPGGPPVSSGEAVADLGAGVMGALGILGAYINRLQTGQGQHVESALVDSCISWLIAEAVQYFVEGKIPEPMGSGSCHRLTRGNQAYRCKGGGYVAVIAGNNRNFFQLCDAIGAEELKTDPRFSNADARVANGTLLVQLLEEKFSAKTRDEWVEYLRAKGIGVAPVNRINEVFADPHVAARELVVAIEHPTAGPFHHLATPIKFSETPVKVEKLAPDFGEATEEIMLSLGYTPEEIATLKEQKVV